MMLNDIPGIFPILGAQYVTRAMSSSTASPGDVAGAPVCFLNNSGATPGTFTTRTAAQMIADGNLQVGQQWVLFLNNDQATGTLTLAGGTGVTISGTATAAGNSCSVFLGVVNTATTITFTRMFNFTTAA